MHLKSDAWTPPKGALWRRCEAKKPAVNIINPLTSLLLRFRCILFFAVMRCRKVLSSSTFASEMSVSTPLPLGLVFLHSVATRWRWCTHHVEEVISTTRTAQIWEDSFFQPRVNREEGGRRHLLVYVDYSGWSDFWILQTKESFSFLLELEAPAGRLGALSLLAAQHIKILIFQIWPLPTQRATAKLLGPFCLTSTAVRRTDLGPASDMQVEEQKKRTPTEETPK